MQKHQQGMHIVINGPCSSGKTSTAKALQELLPDDKPNILLGIDAFHLAIPPSKLIMGKADPRYLLADTQQTRDGPATTIVHGLHIQTINQARFAAIRCFLQAGVNVISDELFWRESDLQPFYRALAQQKVYLFGLNVSDKVGNQRETARSAHSSEQDAGDNYRPQGMYRASTITHSLLEYDLMIDSSNKTPEECARTLAQWVSTHPQPRTFNSLVN